ncbi:MAG: DUF4136 domain-containing protein [Colwellia sp.]|nr:DUF4136 domain-containing protein [Colwellia sp.]
MRNLKLIFLPIILVISACSTTYTAETDQNDEYDFSVVKTYFVVGDDHFKNPVISDIDRNRLNQAIEEELYLNGLNGSDLDSADLLVSYFVVTKDKTKVQSSGHYPQYGYSSRYGHRYGYNYSYNHVSSKNYTEGTFVVDLIDNKTKETVWRSTLTKPIKSFDNTEQRDQAVAVLIKDMFEELPR